MVTIWTTGGVYTGRRVDSIIRRVFGRDAYAHGDLIVYDNKYGTHVITQLVSVEQGCHA